MLEAVIEDVGGLARAVHGEVVQHDHRCWHLGFDFQEELGEGVGVIGAVDYRVVEQLPVASQGPNDGD